MQIARALRQPCGAFTQIATALAVYQHRVERLGASIGYAKILFGVDAIPFE
jgi:hypothetical protein